MVCGENIIQQLLDKNLINNISDIYELNFEDIASLKKNGKKFAQNLIDSINKSKENDLYRLITALGIRHVGGKASKVLARKYKTMENLQNANFEQLSQINDIGEVMANSIIEFFMQEQTKDLIEKLKNAGVNMNCLEEESDDKRFEGKTFVLTGSLELFTRKEAEDIIEKGIEQGIEQGLEKGEVLKLIVQVCRKMQKGKTVEEIAEDLEEPKQTIEQIYKAALKNHVDDGYP